MFSLGDMIMYNRRKRKAFFEEQHALLKERLIEAREAEARGTADEDQILLINRERAAEEADNARKNRPTIWKSVKGVFSTQGLQEEDTHGRTESEATESQHISQSGLLPVPEQMQELEQSPVKGTILQALENKRREGERHLEKNGTEGGVLDKLAEQAGSSAPDKRSWTSWSTSR